MLFRTFVQPIREGRLKEVPDHPWPRGLRPLIWVVTGFYALLTVLGLFATTLRRAPLTGAQDFWIPTVSAPFLVVGVILGMSLLFTAALHLRWWLRVPLIAVLVVVVAGGAQLSRRSDLTVAIIGALAMIGVTIWRWRKPFQAREFLVSLFIIGNLLSFQLLGPALMGTPLPTWGARMLQHWSGLVLIIATPATLLAGAAKTEIVVNIGSWTARGVWEAVVPWRRAKWVAGVLLLLLALGSLAHEAYLFATDPLHPISELPFALLVLLISSGVALAVLRWAPQGERPGIPVDPDDVARHWSAASWPLAFLIAAGLFAIDLVNLVRSLLGQGGGLELDRNLLTVAVMTIGGLALAIRQARRGRTSAALVSAALAATAVVVHVLLRLGWPINTGTTLSAAVLMAVLAGAYLLLRGRLTSDRGLALATVLLLTQIYPLREKLDDPLVAIFAASGTSMTLLAGLLWRQLTEYAHARGNSAAFPNSVRVLLSLANMILVATLISLFALSAEVGAVDLETIESVGDSELGGALLTGSLLAGLLLGLRGREGGDQQPGEEVSLEPFVRSEPAHPFVDFHDPRQPQAGVPGGPHQGGRPMPPPVQAPPQAPPQGWPPPPQGWPPPQQGWPPPQGPPLG